ncbi:MAG: PP2C family protein-serine/threonine phosphatase [Phycisphaerae bacterium]|nr:PP2C family protein-serine/threonine phosphatase [Phycisphaerae bacterium]
MSSVQAHIDVIIASDSFPPALHAALQQTGATTTFWPLAAALRGGLSAGGEPLVILAPPNPRAMFESIEVLLERLADHPRPTLLLSTGEQPWLTRPHAPAGVPISYARAAGPADLAARLSTLIDLRAGLAVRDAAARTQMARAAAAAQRYKHQLELAGRIQRELTGRTLPRFGPVTCRALNKPLEYISGDIFEVAPLDADTLGFFVADATGHGLPAALLTTYIRRAMRRHALHDAAGGGAAGVLQTLNRELLEADLTESPFVAAICGTLHVPSLTVELSRAGTPYPLVRTALGEIQIVECEGCVLGVLEDEVFTNTRLQLRPGDTLVAHTDGLDALQRDRTMAVAQRGAGGLVGPFGESVAIAEAGSDSSSGGGGLTVIDAVAASPALASAWAECLAAQGPEEAIDFARMRFDTMRRLGEADDDLTIVALTIDAE